MSARVRILWALRSCLTLIMPQLFDPHKADTHGLVTITETLNADLLLQAYCAGVFPWSETPVCWYSPDPRAVFLSETIKRPKKIGKIMRRHGLSVTADQAFEDVMRACRVAHEHEGEWIGDQFVNAYSELHERGFAHSIEVWQQEELVGGLYGVQIGAMFAGESMFHKISNGSKVAFASLIDHLTAIGVFFIDAQVLNAHTQSLGAVLVSREDYLRLLKMALKHCPQFSQEKWPKQPWTPKA